MGKGWAMIGVGGAAAAVFKMHLTGCTALATTLPYVHTSQSVWAWSSAISNNNNNIMQTGGSYLHNRFSEGRHDDGP